MYHRNSFNMPRRDWPTMDSLSTTLQRLGPWTRGLEESGGPLTASIGPMIQVYACIVVPANAEKLPMRQTDHDNTAGAILCRPGRYITAVRSRRPSSADHAPDGRGREFANAHCLGFAHITFEVKDTPSPRTISTPALPRHRRGLTPSSTLG